MSGSGRHIQGENTYFILRPPLTGTKYEIKGLSQVSILEHASVFV